MTFVTVTVLILVLVLKLHCYCRCDFCYCNCVDSAVFSVIVSVVDTAEMLQFPE